MLCSAHRPDHSEVYILIGDDDVAVPPYGASWERWADWATNRSVPGYLGLRCSQVGHGRATLVLHGADWLLNPNGGVNGGIVIACADQALGVVAATVVSPGQVPATSNFTSDFLRPAFPPITFHAVVDRVGRTLAFVSVTVRDRSGKVCNEVRGTLVVDGSSRSPASTTASAERLTHLGAHLLSARADVEVTE